MGIKGIYKEIGPGKRISLCKLAVDHFKQTECKRPFRLAVDFAIWAHQLQAAQGGASPAMRTLFYRLVRLVTLNIDPIFVFDGPRKPAFKRNKRSRREGDTLSKAMAQQIIRLFGFATHNAPGEAEAECALLQREGIVDAVLSEDVDTIMFGCTRTLRNWSAEGRNRAQTPTHVSLYDAAEMRQDETGLDREGLVLVALMSGGDYAPEGVPGCGVKLACEAAKAGFGTRLCRIKRSETAALQTWRDDLIRELKTNESKFFRVKHKALTIPEEFPDFEILRHYTHPVVSDAATIARMKAEFPPERAINVVGLRAFTAETFDWSYRPGALKLIRVLAPALLIRALVDCSGHNTCSKAEEKSEASLIQCVVQSRMHFSTDATPELRVKYIPNAAVGLKLDEEEDVDADATSTYGRAGLALNSDDGEIDEADAQDEKEPPKKIYDPHEADLCWVPEAIVKHGAPLIVESWDREQKDKTNRSTKAAKAARPAARFSIKNFGRLTKDISPHAPSRKKKPTE
ncbi:PIN domain-like protein [Coniella lustricola]|uniref:PIN domain-like protein n=1 Tax=Coniella lustricola TaxID=2025994 RepID=A0A2T3ADW5_9PEZI|nr:PIN domain-like protein [Coniella lustricola]